MIPSTAPSEAKPAPLSQWMGTPGGRFAQRKHTKVCMLPVLLRCTPSAKNMDTAHMEALGLPKLPIIGVMLGEREDAQRASERSHHLCAET